MKIVLSLLKYIIYYFIAGLGSPMVEIMADTAVALASANVQLVAKKIIGRMCRVRIFNIVYTYVLYIVVFFLFFFYLFTFYYYLI